jgi:hypothetical protein
VNKCINCDKQLEEANTKPKKFCSDRCRKAYGRDNGQTTKENGQNVENTDIIKDNGQVSATDNVEEVVMKLSTQESAFIPNWKRLGLKTKEEGMKHVIDYLKKQHARISAMGFT